jgi:hypothetical protein
MVYPWDFRGYPVVRAHAQDGKVGTCLRPKIPSFGANEALNAGTVRDGSGTPE